MRSPYHMFIFSVCINSDMVFFDLHFCRSKTILSGYRIRKLFPSILSELILKFLFCQIMIDPSDRDPGKILILFSFFSSGYFLKFQFLRFFDLRITDSFCLVKEYDLSINLHKADLFGIFHAFCESPKTLLFS